MPIKSRGSIVAVVNSDTLVYICPLVASMGLCVGMMMPGMIQFYDSTSIGML